MVRVGVARTRVQLHALASTRRLALRVLVCHTLLGQEAYQYSTVTRTLLDRQRGIPVPEEPCFGMHV